jgi:hypothetical protein
VRREHETARALPVAYRRNGGIDRGTHVPQWPEIYTQSVRSVRLSGGPPDPI